MIKKVTSINDDLFNDAITFTESCERGNIFQHPILFKVLTSLDDFEPFLFVNYNSNKNRIDGSLFGYKQNLTKFGGFKRSLIINGPLIEDNNPEILSDILQNYLLDLNRKVICTEVRNNCNTNKDIFHTLGFQFEDHLNYEIDLQRPIDEIWSSICRKRRNAIHKGIKNNVKIIETGNMNDISYGYKILKKNYKRIGVPLPSMDFFLSFCRFLLPLGFMKVYKAEFEDVVIGILFCLISNGRMNAWYTAIDYDYCRLRTQDVIFWYSIANAYEMGLSVYDLGGAGKPNVDYGPRRFKAKFNGILTNYGRYQFKHRPILMKIAQSGYYGCKKINKIRF